MNGWWYTLPVAFSNGDGTFNVTNSAGVGSFTFLWATTPGAHPVTGDFNGDHKTDIALVGGQLTSRCSRHRERESSLG